MLFSRKAGDWKAVRQEEKKYKKRGCLIYLTILLVWAPPVYPKYGGGDGSAGNPYQIYSPAEMVQIGDNSEDWDKSFVLMSDIDMNDYNIPGEFPIIGHMQWAPYMSLPFTGIFDGNKKKITNLTVSQIGHDFTGLFGYVYGDSALIKDLTLINPKINGMASMYTGSIAGRLRNATISGCKISGGIIRGTSNVGGLAGYNLNGSITNCIVETTVYGSSSAGGITGYNCGNRIENCSFSGTLSGTRDLGGITGENDGQIVNCFATGNITGAEDKTAGLAGTSRGLIKCCYSKANVTGHQQAGGLVGRNSGSIYDSYSHGIIKGSYCVGGLVGLLYEGGTISRCYSVCDVDANAEQRGSITGLVESGFAWASIAPDNFQVSDMMTENIYKMAGWEFAGETENSGNNPWTICEGMNYPRLSWEKPIAGDWACPDGVDIYDIALLAENWMKRRYSADLNFALGDGIVNLKDWAIFSKAWKTKKSVPYWNARCDIWPDSGDELIDIMDVYEFMDRWLTNGANEFDISARTSRPDQIINFYDFTAAADNYQKN